MSRIIKILILLVAFVIFSALIFAGGSYFGQRQVLKEGVETPQPTLADKYALWQTYTNNEFGFSLKFPQTWQEMQLGRGERGFGPGLENPSIMFSLKGLETKDQDFINLRGQTAIEFGVDFSLSINAHTPKQWHELSKKMEEGESIGLKYLGENDRYVFSWERGMRPLCFGAEEGKPCRPPKDLESLWQEIEEIVATFKAF